MAVKRYNVPEPLITGNPFYQLALHDPDTFLNCFQELERQRKGIELIASENITSSSVMAAQGSYLTNKYAEGYPKKRYYGGCEIIDESEQQAIDRAKKLFNAEYANVQPHSGTTANQIVFHTLIDEGKKTILSMGLDQGGHLSHGASVNAIGNFYNIKNYKVHKDGPDKGWIDMDAVRTMAKHMEPKIIVAGGSAYPRIIDFKAFREIADEVGAYLVVDMAHFAGLVAAGLYPSPIPHAHVTTSTTHKTLRGPRGGLIVTGKDGKDTKVWNKTQKTFTNLETALNSATFPGMQGGPLEHVIAAKSVAFQEALHPEGGPNKEFVEYQKQVTKNAQVMADFFTKEGYDVATGGTDTHLILLKYPAGLNGKQSQLASEAINITTNKNSVPYDKESPFIASGSRLGSPAATTRGLQEDDFQRVSEILDSIWEHTKKGGGNPQDIPPKKIRELQERVAEICEKYPLDEEFYSMMKWIGKRTKVL